LGGSGNTKQKGTSIKKGLEEIGVGPSGKEREVGLVVGGVLEGLLSGDNYVWGGRRGEESKTSLKSGALEEKKGKVVGKF